MRQYYVGDQLLDVDDSNFYMLLGYLSDAAHSWAESVRDSQIQGMPDITRRVTVPFIEKCNQEIQKTISLLDDPQLVMSFTTISSALQKLVNIDDQLVDIVARSLDLPAPTNKKDRNKLNQRINKRVREATLPYWFGQYESEWRGMTKQTESLFAEIVREKTNIEKRTKQLNAVVSKDS